MTLKVLTFGFLVLLSYLIYWGYFEENLLIEKKSTSGDKEVIINEYGNDIIIGSPAVKIYFEKDGKTKKTKKIDVDNLKESNFL